MENGRATFHFAKNFKNLSLVRIAQGLHEDALEFTSRATTLIECGTGVIVQQLRLSKFTNLMPYSMLASSLKHIKCISRLFRLGKRYSARTGFISLNSNYACGVVLHSLGRVQEIRCVYSMLALTSNFRSFILPLAALCSTDAYKHNWGAASRLNVWPEPNIALPQYCVKTLAYLMKSCPWKTTHA